MSDLLLPAVQKGSVATVDTDPYYNLVSLHLKGDVNTGRNYNAFSDASSNQFPIVVNGDARGTPFSPYNKSWSGFFDGTGYLEMTYNDAFKYDASQDFALELWAYATSTVGSNYFISQVTSNNWGIILGVGVVTSGRVGISIGNGSTSSVLSIDDTEAFPINQWVHVAVCRTGSTVGLFVNGNRKATATSSNALNLTTTRGIRIGAHQDGAAAQFWPGYLSNIRSVKGSHPYNASLTTLTVPTSPLTAIAGTSFLGCASNRFIDSSASPKALTVVGGSKISSFSPFLETDTTTGSGYFDGTGDFLTAADNAALNPGSSSFTIEAWVYPTSLASLQLIHYKSEADGTGVLLAINNGGAGKVNFYAASGGAGWNICQIDSSTLITANTWTHIAATRNGNVFTLWINGVSAGTSTNSGAVATTTDALKIGRWRSSVPYDFIGYIADYRFVKNTAVYTSTFTPPVAPLPAITNTSLLTLQERGASNTIGFQDESEYQHVITRNGNVAQGTFSPFSPAGWSNYFSGVSDFLSYSTITLGASFTIEFFVYFPTTPSANAVIISNIGAGGTNWVGVSNTAISLSYSAGTRTFAFTPAGGTWYYVQLINSASSLTCYVNGTQVGTAQTGPSSFTLDRVGGYTNVGFTGYLSSVRVNSTALAVSALPTSPLTEVANTVLLTCQSNRFIDNRANPLTLTRGGSLSVAPFSPFKPVAYDPAVHGGSGYFDGTTDNLAVVSPQFTLGTDNLTAECWFYPTAAGNSSTILACKISSGAGFYFVWASTSNAFRLLVHAGTAWNVDASSAALNLNTWNHLVMTREGSTIRTFLNGVLATVTTGITGSMGATAPIVRIGSDDAGSGVVNASYITGVRIVKGVVYPTSLTTTGAQVFTPPSAPAPVINNTLFLLNFTNAGVIDSTGKNVIETVGNAGVVTTTIKKFGSGSMFFDGTGDWFFDQSPIPPTTFGSGDFSIEMWFYTTTTGVQRWLIDGRIATPADGAYPAIYITSGNNLVYYVSAAARITGATAIAANTWYFLQVIRSSGVTKMYLNGTQEGANYPDATVYANPGVGRPAIGVATNLVQPFFGHIDDLRITNGYARLPTTPTKAFPDRGQLGTTASAAPPSVEALVVGGGGSGGRSATGGYAGGGGGGAGGFREFIGGNAIAVSGSTNYALSVGLGGATQTTVSTQGNSGSPSVFSTISAAGGGGGGSATPAASGRGAGLPGGSGGGATWDGFAGNSGAAAGAGNTPSVTPSQGNSGGTVSSNDNGAGGGGAGGAGTNGGGTSGVGGSGSTSSITGVATIYAAGGGGGAFTGAGGAGGSSGVGGAGGASGGGSGSAGTTNTGSGGGGCGSSVGSLGNGGAGGSGIVVLAYPTSYKPLTASLGLTYTIDTVTRPGYRVYKFIAGSGTISW